ncbi:MAG: hypothetical protein DRO46_02175 [Candidatus Hecatellales archaeon]|nr:MAG: hypothetical protein DRO46_02175 [Candidatus Hecatellales archaeon]
MGFGTVFAAAIVGVLLLSVAGAILTSLAEFSSNLNEKNWRLAETIKSSTETSIDITSVNPVTATNQSNLVYVEILNDGSTSIKARHFKYMDVILKYYRASDGQLQTLWLPYSTTGEEDTWTVEEVTAGSNGEILNPVRVASSTGQWDPGETLKIRISLSAGNSIDATPGNPLYILISTPNGVEDSTTYIFSS